MIYVCFCLHNFITIHCNDLERFEDVVDDIDDVERREREEYAEGGVDRDEAVILMESRRDAITIEMWNDYNGGNRPRRRRGRPRRR